MPATNVSNAVVWDVLRKHNSLSRPVRAQRKRQFSAERGNALNVQNPRQSALANDAAVDVALCEQPRQTVLAVKKKAAAKSPGSQWAATPLRRDFRRVARSIKGAAAARPAVRKAALARWSRVYRVDQAAVHTEQRRRHRTKDAAQ